MGASGIGSAGSDAERYGLLPPFWLLLVLMVAAVAAAWATRLSSRTALPVFFSLVLVLPWIPGPVPAALLIWTGHATTAVWLAVIAGVLAARGVRLRGRWFVDPARAPRLAAAVACVLYMTSAWWLAELVPAGDEPHYLIITQSLVRDHDLQIENNYARGEYFEYFGRPLKPDYLRRGTNGQIYSIHAPGLSAVVAPAYAAFGYPGVVLFLSIAAGMGALLLWRASYALTGSASAAWFGWAAGALTVPFFFEAFAVFPDGFGATLVLFAAMPLIESPLPQGRLRWLIVGAMLALLPWLHTRFAIIAGALGLCLLLRLIESPRRRSLVPLFLSVPVVSAVAWFSYFRLIYGRFNPAAPYGGYTQSEPGNILTGLPALLFDQQFGEIANAPVYGFCFVGLLALARRRTRLAIELSLTATAYLLSAAAYQVWWGGTSAPGRFAVPVLLLLAPPGAWLWQHARSIATRAIGLAALVLSIAQTGLLAGPRSGRLAFNVRDGFALGLEWLNPLVDLPRGLPSFFRQTPDEALFRAMFWLLAVLGAWLVMRLIERRTLRADAGVALATPLCLAAAAMLALTAVWKLDHVAVMTPESSQFDLLQYYDRRMRPLGVNLATADLESPEAILSRLRLSTSMRRPRPADRSLLVVPDIVPAGRYRLHLPAGASASGTATLVIGRLARPLLTWDLRSGFLEGSADFDLPVDVGSLVIEGDDDAVRSVGRVELQPLQMFSGRTRVASGFARRVERYGSTSVYFLDDRAFAEWPGFWIRGNAKTRIVAVPDGQGQTLQFFVRNAPVSNRLTLEVDGRSEEIELQPREERMIPIRHASGRAAMLISFHTSQGFKPSLVQRGSTDHRFLGCWIELR